MTLANENCTVCDGSAKTLSEVAVEQLLSELDGWCIDRIDSNSNSGNKIVRKFKLTDFNAAVDCAQRIAKLADDYDHHPSLLLEWGSLTVSWWTHSINGLHKNDFIMAAKTDALLKP